MRSKYLFIIMLFLNSLLLFNCSDVEDKIVDVPVLEGVHKDGFADVNSENFHSFEIQENNWNLDGCKKCHAADFSGGIAKVSCFSCHTSSAGPEACNTCHGDFTDETKIAPPNDLNNNYETTAKGVGAHTTHLYDNELSIDIACSDCHPGNINSKDFVKTHIDGLPAEITFGVIASSGLTSPVYNSDLSCSNIYCHGNFEFSKSESENQWAYTDSIIIGNNFSPKWTKVDDTQAACGTCHLLPPTGHINAGNDETASTCRSCHASAFNEDGTLNRSAHINGEKNLN